MDLPTGKNFHSSIICAIILVFMGFALILRLIPLFFVPAQGILPIADTDTWWNLRQIEVMVNHFPLYNWYDPMTAYPTGKFIDWGPLYPFLSAVLCLVAGASSERAITLIAGLASPIIAVAVIPVVYAMGRLVGTKKTGIAAAGLVTFLSFQYFSMSSFGWVDHHIAEVLFFTLFFLLYLYTLIKMEQRPLDIADKKTLYLPFISSVLAGIILFLGLITTTTVLLALLVIVLFTPVQSVLDHLENRRSDKILLTNSIFSLTSILLLVLFGFRETGFSLSQYSLGIVIVHIALVAETVFLYAISEAFRRNKIFYVLSLGGSAIVAIAALIIIEPLHILGSEALALFGGVSEFTIGVEETLPWSIGNALNNFNVSLILMAGGFLFLMYHITKKRTTGSLFLLIWSLVILYITIHHQRFQYLLTINVVLLAAVCIVEPLSWKNGTILPRLAPIFPVDASTTALPEPLIQSRKRTGNKQKKELKESTSNGRNFSGMLIDLTVITIFLLSAVTVVLSVSNDVRYGIETPQHTISPDWLSSLSWLKGNTPDPGIEYLGQYPVTGFSYPPGSYGVLATWDAGHWITFFSHRIPIANPFQDHLSGPEGSAAFFLSQDEIQANTIREGLGGRYVITDSGMAVTTFTNLVAWQSGSADISPYIKWFLIPSPTDKSDLLKIHRFDNDYFQSTVVRLHIFDGSLIYPSTANYTEYTIREVPAPGETAGDVNGFARVIGKDTLMEVSQVDNTSLKIEGANPAASQYSDFFSALPTRPLQKIPALQHYRLIHESSDTGTVTMFPESNPMILPGIKAVKIFEYVKGAHISGNGTIELPLVTNTGRIFVYRQESKNGEFIVPYATASGNSSEVRATGIYHISGTSRDIVVTENDVQNGNKITD